ncbi:hypothetical protein Tco_0095371 [Tanacetum coccineum]
MNCLIRNNISNGKWSWNWSRSELGVRNSAYLRDMLLKINQVDIASDGDACIWSLANDDVFSDGATRRLIDDRFLPSLDTPSIWDKTLPTKVWKSRRYRAPLVIEMWSLTIISFLNATLLKIHGGLFLCGVIILSLCSFLMIIGEIGLACGPPVERRLIVCISSSCPLFG